MNRITLRCIEEGDINLLKGGDFREILSLPYHILNGNVFFEGTFCNIHKLGPYFTFFG
jgi:hypothetical protein